MKIRELMRPSWSIRADDTLWRAERIMARRRLRYLPVLDGGKLIGIISERDVVGYRTGAFGERDWWLAPVRQVMHEVPPTAAPDESAEVAAERIAASPDALVPVVEQGFLVGVVTATDLLDAELRSWASGPTAVTAGDVMTETLHTVAPTDLLVDAMRLMSDHQIRHLPVVENEVIVGMLSERDLLPIAEELVISIAQRDGALLLRVRDAMTTAVATVTADTSLAEVSRTLVARKIGALPVVDDHHRPIGIVSYVDVLRALAA
jgi:CBS domain-containing protein